MNGPELVERIAAADRDRSAILGSFPADAVPVQTPFYRTARVVDLDVDSGAGRLRLRYGLHGDRVLALGEGPGAVYELNRCDGLTLGRDVLRAYVRFFFDSVGGRKLRIVESTDEIRWRPRGPYDPRPTLPRAAVNALSVEPLSSGAFRAVVSATWDVMLVEVVLEVSSDGRVRPVSERLLEQRLDILPV